MKLFGRIVDPLTGAAVLEPETALLPDDPSAARLRPPISIMLRDAMIVSMSHNWNRSTTSAHVSWNKFSFSNFLKTVDLISTNWLDIRSVSRAFEYELTATFRVMTW